MVKKASKGKMIATIILGVLACTITLNCQQEWSNSFDEFNKDMDKMSGNSTEEVLANDVDVNIGKFEVIKKEFFNETKLVVKVTNKTSEQKSFSLQIEATNLDGSRIASDYIFANSLNPNQSQNFEIFTYVDENNLNAMKNTTFKVVEASAY